MQMAWPCYCFLWMKFMPVSNASHIHTSNGFSLLLVRILLYSCALIYRMQLRINYYFSYVYIIFVRQIFAFSLKQPKSIPPCSCTNHSSSFIAALKLSWKLTEHSWHKWSILWRKKKFSAHLKMDFIQNFNLHFVYANEPWKFVSFFF